MDARWILGTLAVIFALMVLWRLRRTGGRWDPAARTWTLIAVVFAIVVVFRL